jgi:hypothetical protein
MSRLRMLIAAGLVGVLLLIPLQPAQAYYLDVQWDRMSHVDQLLYIVLGLTAGQTPFSASADPLLECTKARPFKVQRYAGGRWKTIARGKSTRRGKIKKSVPDRAGKYRVLVPRHTSVSGFDCFKGVSAVKRHRH